MIYIIPYHRIANPPMEKITGSIWDGRFCHQKRKVFMAKKDEKICGENPIIERKLLKQD